MKSADQKLLSRVTTIGATMTTQTRPMTATASVLLAMRRSSPAALEDGRDIGGLRRPELRELVEPVGRAGIERIQVAGGHDLRPRGQNLLQRHRSVHIEHRRPPAGG